MGALEKTVGGWWSEQLNSTENYGRSTSLSPHHYDLTIIIEHYHFMTAGRFPNFLVPVRSAVKSNLTNWCCQNLSYKQHLPVLTAAWQHAQLHTVILSCDKSRDKVAGVTSVLL